MKEITAEDAKRFTKISAMLCKDREMESVYLAIRCATGEGRYMVKFKIQYECTKDKLVEKGYALSVSQDCCTYISWA